MIKAIGVLCTVATIAQAAVAQTLSDAEAKAIATKFAAKLGIPIEEPLKVESRRGLSRDHVTVATRHLRFSVDKRLRQVRLFTDGSFNRVREAEPVPPQAAALKKAESAVANTGQGRKWALTSSATIHLRRFVRAEYSFTFNEDVPGAGPLTNGNYIIIRMDGATLRIISYSIETRWKIERRTADIGREKAIRIATTLLQKFEPKADTTVVKAQRRYSITLRGFGFTRPSSERERYLLRDAYRVQFRAYTIIVSAKDGTSLGGTPNPPTLGT